MGDTSRGRGGRGPQVPGGGRRGGPRRDDRRRDGRGEPQGARAAGPVDEVTVVVDRRAGVRVLKVSRVERASHRVLGVLYRVEFEGCRPLEFERLGAARDRAKEPPPERPAGAQEPSTADGEGTQEEDAGRVADQTG
jgi:hypothetical protein